jgi:hypothetical protein
MNSYMYIAFVCHRLFEFFLLIIKILLVNINFRLDLARLQQLLSHNYDVSTIIAKDV